MYADSVGTWGCGSSIAVLSTHVCIPQETCGLDLSSWSPTIVPQSTAAGLELRNGPTVPGEPPPLVSAPCVVPIRQDGKHNVSLAGSWWSPGPRKALCGFGLPEQPPQLLRAACILVTTPG